MAKKKNTKYNSKVNTKKISNENEMVRFIKMIIIVTLIFGAFYLLTMFINKEDKETEKENNQPEVTIQYDEILIGNMFKQTEDNYYVLIKDTDDINVKVYEAYISVYKQKEDSKKVYTAVLNNVFNSKYKAEESDLNKDIEKFKVSTTTLLEISKGKIKKSYESQDKILEVLKEISKTEDKKTEEK